MVKQPDGFDVDKLSQKTWPWWRAEIGSRLTPQGRELLERCGVDPNDVETHIRKVRDEAWDVFPFPCIGSFWFIQFGVSSHPRFNDLLARLQALSNRQPPMPNDGQGDAAGVVDKIIQNPGLPRLLDLGTCVGQDLRLLRDRGVPASMLYGADFHAAFEEVGHKLFLDKATFAQRFFAADVFDDAEAGPLNATAGLWDVVNMFMFTHQFDLEQQTVLAERAVRLLRARSGSMILGTSAGQTEAKAMLLEPPFGDGVQTAYRQSKETMQSLWEQAVVKYGGGLEHWAIECVYDEQEQIKRERERATKGELGFFQGDDQRRIHFSVQRK